MWREGERDGGGIVVLRFRWFTCFLVDDRLNVAILASCVSLIRIHVEFDLVGMV